MKKISPFVTKRKAISAFTSFAVASALVAVLGVPASAATYTWQPSSPGSTKAWNANSSWSPNTAFPNAAGDIAIVTPSLSNPLTIDLNQNITIGTLTLGDLNLSNAITIQPNGAFTLTLNNNGAGASITDNGAGDIISAPIVVADTGGNTISETGSFSLLLSGGIAGSANVTFRSTGSGSIQISAASSLTGTTTVAQGTLNLTSPTGALGTSNVIVSALGKLAIDNIGATSSGTTVRAQSVTLNDGTLTDLATGTGDSSTDVITNALVLNGGSNVITITGTGGANATLYAGSLAIGANGGYAFVQGANLGDAFPASNTNGGNIIFATAPTALFVGSSSQTSGGVGPSLSTGIIPELTGFVNTATGSGSTSTQPNTFMTYDSTTGLRPLAWSEYNANSIVGGDNTHITASTTAGATASINSLLITGTTTMTVGAGGVTLTDASGAILFTANGSETIAAGDSAATINFGAAQAVLTADSGNTVTIAPELTGSGGLVKLGAGAISLTGTASTYTGITEVLNGTLTGTTAASFGSSTSTILIGDTAGSNNTALKVGSAFSRNIIIQGGNTGTATFGSFALAASTISSNIDLGTDGATPGTGIAHGVTLTTASNVNTTFSGTITDAANIVAGTGGLVTINNGNQLAEVILTGSNTYTGGTLLAQGVLVMNNANAIGTGTLTINGGSGAGVGIGGNGTLNNASIWSSNFSNPNAVGSLTLNGSVTLTKSIVISQSNASITVGGVIADSSPGSGFGLTITESTLPGSFGLNGLNTFDGGVTFGSSASGQAMTVKIGNLGLNSTASALGTGTFTIGTTGFTAAQTFNNTSGAFGTLSTNNAQVWNASYTFTGTSGLDMGTGVVTLSNLGTSPAITVTVSGNSLIEDGVIGNGSVGNSIIKAGAGNLVLDATETYTGTTSITAGTLQLGNGGTNGSLASNTGTTSFVDAGTLAIDRSDNVNLSIIGNGGNITGAGGLTQAGTGNLTILSNQTYTGTTTVSNGNLTLNGTSTLNSTTGTGLAFSGLGGTFTYDNTGLTSTNTQNMVTLSASAGDNTVNVISGSSGVSTLSFTNMATRGAGATVNFQTSGSASGTIVLTKYNGTALASKALINSGVFFGGSGYAVYDATLGALRAFNYSTDTGALASSGGTTLAATLSGSNVQLTGSLSGQATGTFSTLNFASTGTITMATPATVLSLGGVLVSGGSSATLAAGIYNNLGNEEVIRTNLSTDSLTISGTLVGAGALTKDGAGTLTLSGSNAFSGATNLLQGTLDINNAAALGSGTAQFTIDGGTLDNTSGSAVTLLTNHTVSLAGDFTYGGTGALNLGTGAVSLGANDQLARTVTVNGTGPLTIGGAISNGTNAILPTTALVKAGTGTLVLAGAAGSTYTGGTTINAGTLMISNASGSATGTGAVNVNGGGTLGGSGFISTANNVNFVGSSTSNTANVIVGNGTDTTSKLAITAATATITNATLSFNLDSASANSNTLALGATSSALFGSGDTLTLNILGTSVANAQYELFNSTVTGSGVGGSIYGGSGISYNSSTGVISGLTLNIASSQPAGFYSGAYLKLVADGSGYDIDLEVQSVPEPSTWALMFGGLALLVMFQRYRRQKN
jgi:autotransporter-associated beta strand protein